MIARGSRPEIADPVVQLDSGSLSSSSRLGPALPSERRRESVTRTSSSGEGGSIEELFGRYQRLVLSTSLRILGDIGEAEDLTQAVFFEIHCKAAQFDPL